jgi:DNA-binding MarR family transcriptional regulator
MSIYRINIKKTLVFGVALTISACSNPQDPNETNFKEAIQDFLSTTRKACIEVPNFPFKDKKSSLDFHRNLNELVSIGLLNIEGSETTEITLSLTEAGKKALTTFEKPYTYGYSMGTQRSNVAFCYGDHRVVDITNFTEPANFGGITISRVKFTYTTENFSEWAKNSQSLQSKNRNIIRDIKSEAEPVKSKAVLILTEKGWVHKKLY